MRLQKHEYSVTYSESLNIDSVFVVCYNIMYDIPKQIRHQTMNK